MPTSRNVAGAALFAAVALHASFGTAATIRDHRSIDLGGVNLNYYCSHTYGAEFKSLLIGKTAGDWVCQQNIQNRRQISVTDACKLQYGRNDAKSQALDWNNPLSWRCFVPR